MQGVKTGLEVEVPQPITSLRELLLAFGFVPVWGTASDLDPAYAFMGGGIDIRVTQVTGLDLRPEFLIGGTATSGRLLKHIEQSMPLTVESAEQAAAWLAFAVGIDFRPLETVDWFERGRTLQNMLPWERARALLRMRTEEETRLHLQRPHCTLARKDLRHLLSLGSHAAGWPPAPGRFTLGFDGEVLKLRVRGRVAAVQALGTPWSSDYAGEACDLHVLPRRLDGDPVEVGVWKDMLEVGRVRIPVSATATGTGIDASAQSGK